MARAAPTPGQKLSFIFFIILGSLILYIDITSNNFQSIKNGFKSFKISSSYIAKEISIEPLKSIFSLSSCPLAVGLKNPSRSINAPSLGRLSSATVMN